MMIIYAKIRCAEVIIHDSWMISGEIREQCSWGTGHAREDMLGVKNKKDRYTLGCPPSQ